MPEPPEALGRVNCVCFDLEPSSRCHPAPDLFLAGAHQPTSHFLCRSWLSHENFFQFMEKSLGVKVVCL
jgi:hypothetical protein